MTRIAWPLALLLVLASIASCMTDDQISILGRDTRDLFFHGYINYLDHAFPEDELKPLSCAPQTRNRENPADIGLNDVLGNYSLTLVDSLSTLAILAGGKEDTLDGRSALYHFQDGVERLVNLYGNGTSCGTRACGFDLDSKVQVFETNIRGVGGLLSAHLFAIGELPIRCYKPIWETQQDSRQAIKWPTGFSYNGQLLGLAKDLATRLLPAFDTETGLPYPRVNLRTGIPFYRSSSAVDDDAMCRVDETTSDHAQEVTETCSAGAGSLVLEFTTLSRLTGDVRFEKLAKQAFWAVWNKRSSIGLLGNGIDAETGHWTIPALAGIGAGIDSFFEYAFKSYVLLSSLPVESHQYYDDPQSYLDVWTQSHTAVRQHIQRSQSTLHPFYGQSDFMTGAPRHTWIDNLSAYYPGLLTLAGELDEAIESHLLFAALWTRYSALPERWHLPPTTTTPMTAPGGYIDQHFKHWAGRPEFIESTYYLYQATQDPYYLHVGEMALRDIKRRCWTRCGWADLGNVIDGEQRDRMESFFLGETAKYLYLLFTEDHPLNKGRGGENVIFTTEGHPLIIPRNVREQKKSPIALRGRVTEDQPTHIPLQCPAPPKALPLTISSVANRHDLFHAAALTHLHLVPVNPTRSSPLVEASKYGPGISLADVRSPTNYTFYPWTLPQDLIPKNGMSSVVWSPITSTLTFPDMSAANTGTDADGISSAKGGTLNIPLGALHKVQDGILIHSLSNVRLSMVQEPRSLLVPSNEDSSMMVEAEVGREFRVQGIANWMLGRNEKVLITGKALEGVSPTDPHFTRKRDLEWVDLVLDVSVEPPEPVLDPELAAEMLQSGAFNRTVEGVWQNVEDIFRVSGWNIERPAEARDDIFHLAWTRAHRNMAKKTATGPEHTLSRTLMAAILPTGVGAAPLPPSVEAADLHALSLGTLPLRQIYFLDATLCFHKLPLAIAKAYQVLVIRRGGCSFNKKLANIPSIPVSAHSIQLIIVMDEPGESDATTGVMTRPLLDSVQKTPGNLERRHPIAMVMVDGLKETREALFSMANGLGMGSSDEHTKITDLTSEQAKAANKASPGTGLGVKRRYWFESMGVPIANMIVI